MKHGTFRYFQNDFIIYGNNDKYMQNSKKHFVSYSIIHPDIEALIDKKLAALEGGRVKHTRKNWKRSTKRNNKTRYLRRK